MLKSDRGNGPPCAPWQDHNTKCSDISRVTSLVTRVKMSLYSGAGIDGARWHLTPPPPRRPTKQVIGDSYADPKINLISMITDLRRSVPRYDSQKMKFAYRAVNHTQRYSSLDPSSTFTYCTCARAPYACIVWVCLALTQAKANQRRQIGLLAVKDDSPIEWETEYVNNGRTDRREKQRSL